MNPSVEDSLGAPVTAAATPAPSPAADPVEPEGAEGSDAAEAAAAAEEAAWADVVAGWDDEARHRAYLARFHDLEGLATAGRRYRDVLAARPRDAVAARFRDEVLRRAVAQGLASLPREAPGLPRAKLAVRVAAGLVIGGLLVLAAMMAVRLLPVLSGARP